MNTLLDQQITKSRSSTTPSNLSPSNITVKMSENQAGQHSYAPGYQLDPRLYELNQNRLPPIQPGCQQDRDQGQSLILPPISAFSTEICPREASLNNGYPSENKAYYPYEEQQYERFFTNTEQAHSQGPLPINNNNFQLDSSAAEHMSLSDQHRLQQYSRPPPVCFCPTCGACYTNKEAIQSHFVACVAQNGNPYGVYFANGSETRSTPGPQSERTKKRIQRLDAVNGVVIPSKLAPGESPWISPSMASPFTPLSFACPLCKVYFARQDHIKSHFPACVDHNGNPNGLRWNDGLPVLKRGPKVVKN